MLCAPGRLKRLRRIRFLDWHSWSETVSSLADHPLAADLDPGRSADPEGRDLLAGHLLSCKHADWGRISGD